MLAKEPRFLHRFYGSSSEMMHGNKDDQFPAVGQSKIREKIKSLNFKDCHTKVRSSSIAIGLKWIRTDRGRSLANLDPNQPKRIAFDQSGPCDRYDMHNELFRLHNWTPSWQSEMESVFKSRARFQIIKNPSDDLCRLSYLDHKNEMVSHHKVKLQSSNH